MRAPAFAPMRVTRKQWLTLLCLAGGMTAQQTADSLGVGVATVISLKKIMYRRFGWQDSVDIEADFPRLRPAHLCDRVDTEPDVPAEDEGDSDEREDDCN